MSNFTDFGSGGIKSVQRGVSTPPTSAEMTVTVSAVDPARSVLHISSVWGSSTSFQTSGRLISATQIGITSFVNSSVGVACSWQLVEYN